MNLDADLGAASVPSRRSLGAVSAPYRPYLPQIACGLDYLHSNDVVHRDLKAENLVFVAKGAPRTSPPLLVVLSSPDRLCRELIVENAVFVATGAPQTPAHCIRPCPSYVEQVAGSPQIKFIDFGGEPATCST